MNNINELMALANKAEKNNSLPIEVVPVTKGDSDGEPAKRNGTQRFTFRLSKREDKTIRIEDITNVSQDMLDSLYEKYLNKDVVSKPLSFDTGSVYCTLLDVVRTSYRTFSDSKVCADYTNYLKANSSVYPVIMVKRAVWCVLNTQTSVSEDVPASYYEIMSLYLSYIESTIRGEMSESVWSDVVKRCRELSELLRSIAAEFESAIMPFDLGVAVVTFYGLQCYL